MSERNKHPQKLIIWQPFLLAIVLVVGILLGGLLNNHSPKKIFKEQLVTQRPQVDKVSQVLKYIETQYVDTQNINHLSEVAIQAVLEELDPHSYYISEEEITEVNEKTQGDFEGIGIEFIVVDDTLNVIRTIEDGPAERAGIQAGDQILKADGVVIAGISNMMDSVKQTIKGPSGTSVDLLVKRVNEKDPLKVAVERSKIPYHAVSYSHLFPNDLGYIKLNHFNGNAYTEFMQSLEDLAGEDDALNYLVIDLRGNPGGYLQEVVKILSQLFNKKGKLLVYTNGRNARKVEYKSTGMNYFNVENIAVFVNENSASASEILAGAIQDWERGVVIGRRTFGKGLVQEQFPLSDGSAIRLTTSRYHTPTGRLIQRPYDVGDYNAYLDERFDSGELFNADSIEVIDTITYKTPSGNAIKAGSGIIPDLFIPIDSFSNLPFVKSSYEHIVTYIYKDVQRDRKAGNMISRDELGRWWNKKVFTDTKWQNWLTYLSSKDVSTEVDLLWLPQVRDHLESIYKYYYVNYSLGFEYAVRHDLENDPYFTKAQEYFLSDRQLTEMKMNK